MNVTFWYDPNCPFCWMTSRWIVAVAPDRDLEVDWQPISLLLKNSTPPDSRSFAGASRGRALLRVAQSVRDAGGADRLGDLYTAFGRRIHNEGILDFGVEEVLEELGLEASHAAAVDDESFDTAILAAMDEAFSLTGTDVGTPLVAIGSGDRRVGLFGPVITRYPSPEAGLRLWDGFVAMAETDGFYELKRTRDESPDVPPV